MIADGMVTDENLAGDPAVTRVIFVRRFCSMWKPFVTGKSCSAIPAYSGSSVNALTCRGRTTVKSHRFRVAMVARFSRSAIAMTDASTPPRERLA